MLELITELCETCGDHAVWRVHFRDVQMDVTGRPETVCDAHLVGVLHDARGTWPGGEPSFLVEHL